MGCVIDGCGQPRLAWKLCSRHYQRLSIHGTTDITTERFWRQVEKTDTCWLWTGTCQHNGYGRFTPDKELNTPIRTYMAHRWSYEMHKASIPDGLTIDHLCRRRNCVNPDHLEAVTMQENFRRGLRGELVEDFKWEV